MLLFIFIVILFNAISIALSHSNMWICLFGSAAFDINSFLGHLRRNILVVMFSELLHSRNIFQVTIWEMIRRFLRKLLKPSLVTTSPRTLRKLCCALITALCDIGLWIRKQYNCINIYTLFIHKAILTVMSLIELRGMHLQCWI